MKPSQFTVQDLLWTTALIGVACGLFKIVAILLPELRAGPHTLAASLMPFLIWPAAVASMTAGLCAIFRRKLAGAIVGFTVALIVSGIGLAMAVSRQ